jgi:TRAP-type C4-dicarboxylate transport system substrate-binding protein
MFPVLVSAEEGRAKKIIKLATIAPKGHTLTKRLEVFNEEVKRQTNNDVEFRIYWGGVQGDDQNVLRKIRLGQLHGAFFTSNGLGQIVPQIRVTEIPYVFHSDEEVNYVRETLQNKLLGFFEEKGFIVIGGLINVGFVYNFSKVPVTSLDQLKKMKCWVPEDDPLGQAIYKALNIQPVPLSLNDVMTSVSTNLIDTAGITPLGALAFRWYTKFTYMSDFPIINIVGAHIVSKKMWNKISHENQEIIKTLANSFSELQQKDISLANAESIKLLKESGMQIVHVDPEDSPEDLKFLLDAGVKARESQVGELYSQELMDDVLKLVGEYREKNNIVAKIPFIQ